MSTPDDEPHELDGPHELRALVYRLSGDQAEHARRLRDVEDQIVDCAVVLDEIRDTLAAAAAANSETGHGDGHNDGRGGAGAGAEEATGLDLPLLVEWVRVNVADLLQRRLPQTGGYPHWCRRWWEHPEAIARFEAARRCWEEAVQAGPGSAMVVYFEHLDHQLAQLMADSGPFSGCTGGIHAVDSPATALGQETPPQSYYGWLNNDDSDQHDGDGDDGGDRYGGGSGGRFDPTWESG